MPNPFSVFMILGSSINSCNELAISMRGLCSGLSLPLRAVVTMMWWQAKLFLAMTSARILSGVVCPTIPGKCSTMHGLGIKGSIQNV